MALWRGLARRFRDTRSAERARPSADGRARAIDATRLEALVARLRAEGAPDAPTAALARWLAEASDADVAAMRPLELAALWGTDPTDTLETFLRATVVGLLEVRWQLVCPYCHAVAAERSRLGELPSGADCHTCNRYFTTRTEEQVEVRFAPTPMMRRTASPGPDQGAFARAKAMPVAPRATPVAELRLPPGGAADWSGTLAPGLYLLHSPQSRGVGQLRVTPDAPARGLEVSVADERMAPDEAHLRAGRVTIRATNGTDEPLTLHLGEARWSELAATPGRLMAFPAFRALFSAEALAPGVELSIGRVGLLFTDLAGSTALYERVGDARAFRLVEEHFELLREAIEGSGGALVKTIGDATMGAFPDGRGALAAALAIQAAIRELDTVDLAGQVDPARLVKAGVHAGACFAVTLNERLDYFGTAVNLAARAQHEARGGEIVLTGAVNEEAADLLAVAGRQAEPFVVQLRGLSAPVELYRVAPTP